MWPFGKKRPLDAVIDHHSDSKSNAVRDRYFALSNELKKMPKGKHEDARRVELLCQKMIKLSPEMMKSELTRHNVMRRHSVSEGRDGYKVFEPLGNLGFLRLCDLREKQGRFQDAVDVAKAARKQGWKGDWDSRIARLERKRDEK